MIARLLRGIVLTLVMRTVGAILGGRAANREGRMSAAVGRQSALPEGSGTVIQAVHQFDPMGQYAAMPETWAHVIQRKEVEG